MLRTYSRRSDRDRSKWRAGAAYLSRNDGCDDLARVSWDLDHRSVSFDLSIDDGDGPAMCLTVAPGVFLFASVAVPQWLVDFARRKLLRGVEHGSYEGVNVLRIAQIDTWTVHWEFVHPDGSWSSSTPVWRSGSWDLADAVLGRVESETEISSTHDIEIPMPEGAYRWSIKLLRDVHKRPWWPYSRVSYGFDAEPYKGEHIPFPGKGENSWDCGPDALFGSSGPGRSIADAIGSIVGSVLSYRQRDGGTRFEYVIGGKYDPDYKPPVEGTVDPEPACEPPAQAN